MEVEPPKIMKVLMISADPAILMPGTDAAQRMREYAGLFDELHIVVLCRVRADNQQDGNLFLYAGYGSMLPMRFFRAWRLGRSCMMRAKCAVISAQGADETGIIAWLLSRRYGIPFQLQLHTDSMSPWYRAASWKEHLRYQIARFLIPRADCMRVVSKRIANSLPQTKFRSWACPKLSLGQRVDVLPIFTDVSKFVTATPDPATEQRFAGFNFKMIAVGRFVDKEKNFGMLINAMRIFVRICPTALLVIVGEGPDRKYYESRIKNQGLEKNVILEPWRDDLASFYKSFDLFVSSSNYEGWGRAVIEALAAGLPVVMTDTGLAGEVIKNHENGIVVPVGDAQALLQAIKMLYENPQTRKQLAAAGQQTAKNLQPATLPEYLARYRQSFDSCVSARDAI